MEYFPQDTSQGSEPDPTVDIEPQDLSLAEKLDQQRELAKKLGPFVGMWVMVLGSDVIRSANTPKELFDNEAEVECDRVFRVLDGKKRLILSRLKAA